MDRDGVAKKLREDVGAMIGYGELINEEKTDKLEGMGSMFI